MALIALLPFHLAVTAAFFFICLATGLFALKILRCELENPLEKALAAVLAGFAAHCYLIWFLGLAGFCGRVPLLIIYGLMLLALLILGLRQPRALLARNFSEHQRGGWSNSYPGTPYFSLGRADWKQPFWIFILSILAVIFLQQLFSSHAPPVWRDDLSYHLYIPKAYLEMGRIEPPPFDQRQSYYHQIINMSYLPLMAAGGDIAAKLANFFWQIIFVLLGFALFKRMENTAELGSGRGPCLRGTLVSTNGVTGAKLRPLVLLLIGLFAAPGVLFISETAMTDLPAACFALGGLLAYLCFENSGKSMRFLGLSALLAAFALNKYTAWSYFLATPLIFSIKNFKNAVLWTKGLALYALCAMVSLAPFALFLFSHTGNPVYPIPFLGLPHDSIEAAAQGYLQGPKNPQVLLQIAWKNLFGGANPDSSALIALAPAALLWGGLRRGTAALLFLWAALAYLIRFFAVGESALLFRYILPTYAILILFAAEAIERVWEWGKAHRIALKLVLALALIYPSLRDSTARSLGHLRLNLGLLDFESYMRRLYPGEGWDMKGAVNALPPDAKTAVLDHHFIPYYYDDLASRLKSLSAEALALNDPDRIRLYLEEREITHVLFIPSRWHAVKTTGGFVLLAKFMGPHLVCRWWEKTQVLDFLKIRARTPEAVLFEFTR